jgi:hypothetical protein
MRSTTIALAASAVVVLAVGIAALVGAPAPTGADEAVGTLLVDADRAEREIVAARAAAPPTQAGALADLRVTVDEYRAATDRTIACLEDRLADAAAAALGPGTIAVEVTEPRLTADSYALEYRYGLRPTTELRLEDLPADADEQVAAIAAACQEAHVDEVERAYQLGLLADASYVRDVDEAMRSCLAELSPLRRGESARQALARIAVAEAGDTRLVDCVADLPSVTDDPTSR